jgi:SM-20-related protein
MNCTAVLRVNLSNQGMKIINNQVYPDEKWIGWIDRLAADDIVIVDDFLPHGLFRTIMDFAGEVERGNRLDKAGIGSSNQFKVISEIRGDYIYWLDSRRDEPLMPFFLLMDELTEKLKRYCFLSLAGSEYHLAKYPPNSFYKRHLDQFKERSNRQITVLIYLNENWKPGDGGELKAYKEDRELIIEPIANRLVLFKSDTVEHEVLPTRVPRNSLTGWLLHHPKSVDYMFR